MRIFPEVPGFNRFRDGDVLEVRQAETFCSCLAGKLAEACGGNFSEGAIHEAHDLALIFHDFTAINSNLWGSTQILPQHQWVLCIIIFVWVARQAYRRIFLMVNMKPSGGPHLIA